MNLRIDAHQHYWRIARGDYGWLTPERGAIYRDYGPADLAPALARHRIDGTVLVQAAPTLAETEFMLGIAHATPSVLGLVGWVDFESPDAQATIARLARDPLMKSLRPMAQDLPDADWMARPALDPAFDALVANDIAFDALVKPRNLKALLARLERHPALRVVVDHGGKPEIAAGAMAPWADDIAAIAAHPQVHCKLSGLATEAAPGWTAETLRPYAGHLFACFRPERIMFGSDWPVLNLKGSYDGWIRAAEDLCAHLPPADFQAVFGGNAARFYRLTPRG